MAYGPSTHRPIVAVLYYTTSRHLHAAKLIVFNVVGDVKRNDGKEAWGMGLNFRFPWQKKKDKEDAEKKAKK